MGRLILIVLVLLTAGCSSEKERGKNKTADRPIEERR